MFLPLDPSSGVPIYRQIIDQVRRTLAAGNLAEGERLPSVREMAARLQINPLTVAKAYRELERDGLLEMRRGMGMYVAEGAPPSEADPELERMAARYAIAAMQAGLSQTAAIERLRDQWREIKQREERS